MNIDEKFMQRALELASLGKETTSPNPMVGCVIVHENKIIGEGYHQKYGEAHAEVNAINSVNDKSLLEKSTAYVSLEPCVHFGKTPPCADLLIKYKIPKVVICNTDPFPDVDGKGITKLQDAGIEVSTGVLEKEGLDLNKTFFTSIGKNRPYIILKWAETADGYVATADGKPLQISNIYSGFINHKWRAETDAILVGINTVINDNPALTTRNYTGKNPIRVIIDRKLSAPTKANIFDNSVETIIINEKENKRDNNTEWVQMEFDKSFLQNLLEILNAKKIRSIIVEGGPRLHQLFINENAYDEVRVIRNSKTLGSGIKAVSIPPLLKSSFSERVKSDNILYFFK